MSGPNAAAARAHRTISATSPPISSAQSAPRAASVPPSCCHTSTSQPLSADCCAIACRAVNEPAPGGDQLPDRSRRACRYYARRCRLASTGRRPGGDLVLPDNISLLPLPPYSPELNPVENIWQYLRQNHLANRVFDTYDAILDACCDAWNALTGMPDTIRSIATREWAKEVST